MAKLNMYEQQTTMGSVRADPGAFGAGIGQAVAQAGNVMEDIGDQIMRRSETIEMAKMGREIDEWGQQSLTALNDTEDISSPDTVAKFEAGMREKSAEVLSRFSGRSGARAALQASLENQTYQYVKSAKSAQIKAQHEFIASTVEQTANSLALKAAEAPGQIDNIFAEFDSQLDRLGPAMSPGQAEEYRASGRAKLAVNALSRLQANGQFGTAKELMGRPDVAKYLSPDITRKFTIDIAVDESKAESAARAEANRVASWGVRLGRNLTAEEVIKIKALPEKKDMTVADQITEYELVTGKPVTQDVVDQFYKLDGGSTGSSSMFGNSLQGRSISFVTENAIAYANGMLSPLQARQYEAAFAEAYKPTMRPNPVTGQMEPVQPSVPNFVTQAMEQGSRAYGGVNLVRPSAAGGAMPGQRIELRDNTGRVIGQTTVGPDGNWSIKDYSDQSGDQQAASKGQKTIWEMAPDLAGPVPAIKTAAGDIPYVGGMLEGGGETASNRAYVKTQVSQMVDALSINPRNPVALVEMIRKEIDVDPKVLGDPAAYQRRIEGVNRSLTERLAEETAAGANPDLPAKTRQDALDVANTIRNFQQKLMPPQVKNRKELDSLGLPPGSKFIDPNGVLRQIP
jgi:hypothetical protein